MSKNLKKTILFFVFLVAAILIITCIYLLMNSNQSGTAPSPSPSASASVTPPTVSPSPSESASTESPTPTDKGAWTREETPDGALYHFTVPGGYVTYDITVDEKLFGLTDTDGHIKLTAKADQNEFLDVTFVKDGKAEALAPSFLDQFIDYKEFEQSGQNNIDGTDISGETVTGSDGQREVTAWLVDTDSGVLAVAISYNVQNKTAQTAELDKMLATLAIEQ